jgi:glutathione-regulated potassium-efflux system ancillary protein KefC
VAVVYSVLLELGLNRTAYGKGLLAACFVNDLATVIGLGLLFSPLKTLAFVGTCVVVLTILPWLTPRFFRRYGNRPSELETKYLLLVLFALGAAALWAESEPVLPAYLVGMILAGTVGKGHTLVRRLRTLTLGMLTPFYFIRAGSFVSIAALATAPLVLVVLLIAKMATKLVGVYPITQTFRQPRREAMYTTLLMSTGLTFGSISALYGLTHGIVDQMQYSYLIATVVGSAVVPTMLANAFFLPRHLLPPPSLESEAIAPAGTTTE